ncbi:glycosyltransferase [Aestuariivivens sediminicola]|uniref:glycosyltransferase n=1 Tax=Aestuariivivens sediminicola TaxID=2913560 RepID=UPI001F56DF09|nr:glycosyltransferase [Aestuariivivens sediminicola]
MTFDRIIIAYACEDSGSEPGVGYFWTKAISRAFSDDQILLITRKNNDLSKLLKERNNIHLKGIDISKNLLFIKKFLGTRPYYIIWQFIVFTYLINHYKIFKNSKIHQVTFTPMYYPPIFFLLPFKFVWGPLGGGESYPLSYLKELKPLDKIKEVLRLLLRYSIYLNPLFYLGCIRSEKIICSTPESSDMIPRVFNKKVMIELMVFDFDKKDIVTKKDKTIVMANRLIDWKITHLFVEAFKEFNEMNLTDYKLIIIGDGPYFKKIEPFLDYQSIIHIKRFSSRKDMLSILKKSSLFVSMSLRDSGAASLLEAISYGVPFLVSASGAHKVYLDQNIGFSFKLDNFNEDKLKIKSILGNILTNEYVLKEESSKVLNVYNSYFSEKVKIKRIQSALS